MLRFTGSPACEYSAVQLAENDSDYLTLAPSATAYSPSPWHQAAKPSADPIRPVNPLIAKLGRFAKLEARDLNALEMLVSQPKLYRSGHILIHENALPDHVYLIVKGMACRYKLLPTGQRQILGYLTPGDMCDIHFVTLNRPDHSVVLLADSQVVRLTTRRVGDLLSDHPRIERALSLSALLDIAILREWLLNVGQRNALQKISHFFCEMKARLEAIGQVSIDGSFELPVNQSTLADTTGLTPVHVNRTLQRLRADGLIKLSQRRLAILDPDRLATLAEFDDNYLTIKQCQR